MKKLYKITFLTIIAAVFVGGVFFLKNKRLIGRVSAVDVKKQTGGDNIKTQTRAFQAVETEKKQFCILFLGDLMFDRYIRQVAEKKGNEFIFEKVRNLLLENDLVVANLEGPITDNASKSINTQIGEKNHLIFTFDKNLAGTLFGENIKLVNLGNNHILNFGSNGLDSTKKYLSEARVEYFGDGDTIVKNINGTRIGFVNYNQFCSRDALQCVSN